MRNGFITKRIAPQGYVAVTIQLAEQLFNEGKKVTLCGNNVNNFHVFDGWRLGCTIVKENDATFTEHVKQFMQYMEKELGRYPVFYVQRGDIVNEKETV